MEALKEEADELSFGSSVESLQKMLDSQKELFHSQIDQLQDVVLTQCNLTGVNPLAQEMAAGALSIKIGKRPRDLLNPKAVKYMQAVFAIKDAISKKESREISALFGVTLAQVRDFFASQRTRVRKQVRLSQEKSIKSAAGKGPNNGVNSVSDLVIPLEPVPLDSVGPITLEGGPSCSSQDASLVGIDEADKHFVENIFSMMQREETFSGQVKVMEWILKIQNPAVLQWFLTRGGAMILATWLSEASIEEQTTVLLIILKVLFHLPLHKAFPEHMSAILQSVNGLRFYRASDVSNRARMMLSRWSKLIARSQAVKKPNGVKSSTEAQNELLLKQSINEIMGDESWQSHIENPEGILALPNASNLVRKSESPQPLKFLPSPADDSSRKHTLCVSATNNRVRRKVQLVEQPGQKVPGKSLQTTKIVQGRPISADDIQKAKMRAMYMQSKYGKAGSSCTVTNKTKIEGPIKCLTAQADVAASMAKVRTPPKTEEQKKPATQSPCIIDKLEIPLAPKPKLDPSETSVEKCKQMQIRWQKPPEFELNYIWRVGAGEHSKEIDVQKNRNRREKETVYRSTQEMPFNPKEPWDREMDYDDSLTPEILTEQQPDFDSSETQAPETEHVNKAAVSVLSSSPAAAGGTAAEPDLELLAVLLKNPELVFALTSGQAANLTSEQTVKLLDMIKAGGAGNMKDFGGKREEKVEVSLPSPTPSSNPGTSGWRPEERNPFSQSTNGNRVASTAAVTAKLPSSNFAMPHQQANGLSIASQQLAAAMPQLLQGPENRQSSVILSHPRIAANSLAMETQAYISNMKSPPLNTSELHTSISLPVTRMQSHPQLIPQSNVVHIGSDSDTWGTWQQLPPNHYGHVNVNTHNLSFSRPLQLQSGPVPHLERNRYVGGQGLRSWSPEDSPTRAQPYTPGQAYTGSGINPGLNYRPDRSWAGSAGLQDHNMQESRGWRDRRG